MARSSYERFENVLQKQRWLPVTLGGKREYTQAVLLCKVSNTLVWQRNSGGGSNMDLPAVVIVAGVKQTNNCERRTIYKL